MGHRPRRLNTTRTWARGNTMARASTITRLPTMQGLQNDEAGPATMDLLAPLSAPMQILAFGRMALRCGPLPCIRSQLNNLLPRDESRGLRAIERGPAWSEQCAAERQGALTALLVRISPLTRIIAIERVIAAAGRRAKTQWCAALNDAWRKAEATVQNSEEAQTRSRSFFSSFHSTFPFPTSHLLHSERRE